MVIRIRLRTKLRSGHRSAAAGQAAAVVSSLLTPLALMAWALGTWSLLAAMNRAGEFAFRSGIWSRWQVWMAVGVFVQFAAFLIGRVGRSEDEALQEAATQRR
ncbi:MAG TPA: hypothetical protein VES20_00125 [Bryobacteraceae bacterium]|nr:hypothetical protein [Bryobacteraceae bacterium]